MGSFLSIIAILFLLWELYDCFENEPDRDKWLWIIIIGNIFGALLYVAMKHEADLPGLSRFSRRRELRNDEYEAQHIGGAYQYTVLGNIQTELGDWKKAKISFETALEKDSKDSDALWGLANAYQRKEDFASALPFLERLVNLNPTYKIWEGFVMQARALYELKRFDEAQRVLDQYKGIAPLADYLRAAILKEKGDSVNARKYLQRMLEYMHEAPLSEHKKYGQWVGKAKRLLRNLPADPASA